MPYTQADIDALKARIAQFGGVRESSFGDQSTTFDQDAAMKLLEKMEREVAGGVARTRYATTSKDC